MNWEEEELLCVEINPSLDEKQSPERQQEIVEEKIQTPPRARRSTSFRKRKDSDSIINFPAMFKRRHSLDTNQFQHAVEEFSGLSDERPTRTKTESTIPQKRRDSKTLECSDPTMALSPRGNRKKEEINEAVDIWAGKDTEIRVKTKKSPKLKSIKRRISRSLSREKMEKVQQSSLYSAKFSFAEVFDGTLSVDPRITDDIALFYLRQQLPEDFPYAVLHMLFIRASKNLQQVQNILIDRGWELKFPDMEEDGNPFYYFGSWSYDCWTIFDGKPSGSFITCHKQNRYYVMYKDTEGKVVLDAMNKGPLVPRPTRRRLQLQTGIQRPPKRFICEECSQNTPCDLTETKETHKSILRSFILSFPLQISYSPVIASISQRKTQSEATRISPEIIKNVITERGSSS